MASEPRLVKLVSNMSIPTVLISVPTYQAVQPDPFIHFLTFSQETGKAESAGRYSARWFVPGPKIKTVVARNAASQIAISGGADYLLLIDDDMVVPCNLLDLLLRHDVDIVVPLFFRATPPIEPLIFDIDELGDRIPIYEYPKDALFEVPGGAGTGVMLIKIDVLKAMDVPIWRGSIDPTYAEDIEFCRRAKELGFRVWCDSSTKIGQMSLPVAIGEKHYKRLTEL